MEDSSLAVDFGTSNTLIAAWDEVAQQVSLVEIPEYSRWVPQNGESIPLIPSLIHYSTDGRVWIGHQVIRKASPDSRRTVRWMKQYILSRSPIRLQMDSREITPSRAASDFLTTIFTFMREEQGIAPRRMVFSTPVESFEFYTNWLNTLAEDNRYAKVSLIDEPIAAAIGYGLEVRPGTIFFVFDFGGGTMNAAMVIVEGESISKNRPLCRALGKAGKNIGGARIDQWLYQEILSRYKLSEDLSVVRQNSHRILSACERVKQTLSQDELASTGDIQIDNNLTLNMTITRGEFEKILERNFLFDEISQLCRHVLNQAYERGYTQDQIHSVIMIGGSSLIPAVQQHLRSLFGDNPVQVQRPLDAVVRGAALYAAGSGILDHIRHDYAIRYLDPSSGQYVFQKIVFSGTPYPTLQPISRLTVKASYSGQRKLGLAIFEVRNSSESSFAQENIELIFDPKGFARIVQLPTQQIQERTYFFVNEHCPTFLIADPPAEAGTPRFEVFFYIDAQKRLTINVRDLKTGSIILENQPVIRLY